MLEPWQAWCQLLMTTLKEEATATLRDELLVMERMVLLEDGYVLAESEGQGKKADMSVPLNRVHKTLFRLCLEKCDPVTSRPLQVLYELYV